MLHTWILIEIYNLAIFLSHHHSQLSGIHFVSINCVSIGFEDEDGGNVTCKPLSKSDYIHLIWTTVAEFPG